MDLKYLQSISAELNISQKQVTSVQTLISEDSTIPFISRYRKEATGNLDEVQIAAIAEKLKFYDELQKRKETVLKTIEEQGKLTSELKEKIENTLSASELEDMYLPYKPKRKTRAVMAIEKGLEPLATLIFEQLSVNPEEEANGFVSEQVKDAAEALQGARDIIAEWVNENAEARNKIRSLFEQKAIVSSKVFAASEKNEEALKYKDYFDFSEPLKQSPSHRILAMRRGEKEGHLLLDIAVEKQSAIDELKTIFIKNNLLAAQQVQLAIEDGYQRLLKPSIETEFRATSKQFADEEAIRVFAENLRQLLLASPLGAKRVLAIDPGFRTGCKVVCLDENGAFLEYETIFPHQPQNDLMGAEAKLKYLVSKHHIEAIGYGNGTASKETEELVRGIHFEKPISIFMVNESGASIYSASDVAREEFPDKDVTVRGAISIGRRLLDPLSELVKIDPKSIGVGQYQHDVNQVRLRESLDQTVESCVNYVGVNVNTASKHLLAYVSGLSKTTAANIVAFRNENGAFANRKQLLKVPALGPKAFEQSAGFLRIPGGENPLDNSAVHPESYGVVEDMAKRAGVGVSELLGNNELRKNIKAADFVSEKVGQYTVQDILKELEKPGRDPRAAIEEFKFAEGINTMADLKTGMELPGIVTNITAFGAFVDIGVKQDGLVHVSHLANRFVKDPNEVVKLGQKVKVTVLEVDASRKRIALSMKGNQAQSKPQNVQQNFGKKPQQKHESDFGSSLEALKKKFVR